MRKQPLISIVDDDQFVRDSLGRLMKSFGFAVAVFPSAIDFLESPHLGKTACLIADIQMPVTTGVELHTRLIEQGRAIPTILITAYPDDGVRSRVLKNGVVGYLSKPFRDGDLLHFIRLALELGELPGENS